MPALNNPSTGSAANASERQESTKAVIKTVGVVSVPELKKTIGPNVLTVFVSSKQAM
jgi:hypothetical protein